jgi:protease-4
MNRRAALVLATIFGGFFLLFLVFLMLAFAALRKDAPMSAIRVGGGPKIGVVEIVGTIGDGENGVDGKREAEQLRTFAKDDSIEAVVVRIDSPGGAVAPSQEIWQEIKRTREKKKVLCSMGNLAASGGYYIAVACEEIMANPGTLTGSIGVISQFFDASEWLPFAKLEATTLKTGALKDSGSPLRDFSEEDRVYFNGLLEDIFGQFLQAVAEGRRKSVDEIRPLADGRVFTGVQAQKLGLVDSLGNFRMAVDRVMELAGLEGDPQLVYAEEADEFEFLKYFRGGARAVARDAVEGAVDGITASAGARTGILLLAPALGQPKRR